VFLKENLSTGLSYSLKLVLFNFLSSGYFNNLNDCLFSQCRPFLSALAFSQFWTFLSALAFSLNTDILSQRWPFLSALIFSLFSASLFLSADIFF
jgi:hypothetical protein